MTKVSNKSLFCVNVLVVIALIFLAGLSFAAPQRMYTGPERPASETALVKGAASEINIVSCDGVKATKLEVSVLPGEHVIEMSFRGDMEYSEDTSFLKFTAEAGHTYIVDREDVKNQQGAFYNPFILDKTTGKRVSDNVIPPSKLEERLVSVERYLKGHPQNADFLAEKGALLTMLGRYEEALPALEAAISYKSDSAGLWAAKSAVLYQMKRYNDALTAIDRAIQLLPNEAKLKEIRQEIINAMGKDK